LLALSLPLDRPSTIIHLVYCYYQVCSGQSNMVREMNWANASTQECDDAAANYPFIRLFQVDRSHCSAHPQQEFAAVSAEWARPGDPAVSLDNGKHNVDTRVIDNFAATCWFFGRDLYNGLPPEKKVPVGLVLSSVGGTKDECWSSAEALSTCGLKPSPDPNPVCRTGKCGASQLWNAMINPMVSLTIRGTVWYQGEREPTSPPLRNHSLHWSNSFGYLLTHPPTQALARSLAFSTPAFSTPAFSTPAFSTPAFSAPKVKPMQKIPRPTTAREWALDAPLIRPTVYANPTDYHL
jgi:hypothetical protein